MQDTISVIVPIYNVEKYLTSCINSILRQTYRNLEILLIDDGSTDGCAAICDEYKEKDTRIKVIHKKNGGLSSARNAGIDAATGEILSFVDSDDFIEPDMLEMLYRILCTYDADMTVCNFRYVDEKGRKINAYPTTIVQDECLGQIDLWEKVLAEYGLFYVVAWNKLYRRYLWTNLRYPIGKINEDEFVLHGLIQQCKKIGCTSYIGYSYVQRGGSIMSQKIANFDVFEAWQMRIEYFHSINRDDFVKKQLALFGERLSTLYFLCKASEEKRMYHRTAKRYDYLSHQFYRGLSIPGKEQIKILGCRRVPGLLNLVSYAYLFLWIKIWNWRNRNGKHHGYEK